MNRAYLLLLTVIVGCSSIMVPEYEGPVTDHYDGSQFYNLDPSEDKSLWTILKWRFLRVSHDWPEKVEIIQAKPAEKITDKVRLTFVNHSTVLIQTANTNFLIDPVWSKSVGPTSWLGPNRHHEPGIAFSDLPFIDFVLISHNHYDHMDLPTLERLKNHSNPVFFVGLGNKKFLGQSNLNNANDLDWWQAYNWGSSITINSVPARHWSMRSWGNRRETLWTGYVVETPKAKIFYAGDTGWGKHFDLIHQKYGDMDICILPIGAYLPVWFMHENHITPDEAVQAHKLLGCKNSIGVHFGTFQQSDEEYGQPEEDLLNALKSHNVNEEKFRILKPGERWEL